MGKRERSAMLTSSRHTKRSVKKTIVLYVMGSTKLLRIPAKVSAEIRALIDYEKKPIIINIIEKEIRNKKVCVCLCVTVRLGRRRGSCTSPTRHRAPAWRVGAWTVHRDFQCIYVHIGRFLGGPLQ